MPSCGAALTRARHNTTTGKAVHCAPRPLRCEAGQNQESKMNFTAGKVAVVMIAAGVALGGCATRESVRNAQASADAANQHAGTAQARADEAYGVGNNALSVGNNALGVGNSAMASAQQANQKADMST